MTEDKHVAAVVRTLIELEAYQVVKFLSAKRVIRATKPRYRRQKTQWRKSDRYVNLVVSIGEPNYLERAVLAKRGVPRQLQVRDFPRAR